MNKNGDKRSYKNCCSAGCINTTFNCDLTFFSLPSDTERRSIWLKLLQREDLEDNPSLHYRVCEKHFDTNSILVTPTRKLLKRQAMPRRLLPADQDPGPSQPDLSTTGPCTNCKGPRTLPPQTSNDINPRKRRLTSDTPNTKKDDDISTFFALCDKFLTKKLAEIIKVQLQGNFYDFGNRQSNGYKIFCFYLYSISPKAYELLSDVLRLPKTTSLLRVCEPVAAQPEHIMEALKLKAARMTDKEKDCCVFIDAIKLKTHLHYSHKDDRIYGLHHEEHFRSMGLARYGLVAVVQGIFGAYRQLVGLTLLAADADETCVVYWTNHLIRQLIEAGLNVKALVSASSYPFLNTANNRSVSVRSPYFFVNKRKIYYMFDPAQLIVELRDSLMVYDFHFSKSVAKWDDICRFFDKDGLMQLKIAPKLSERHLEPSAVDRAQVELAMQVFSAPVAAGIAAYAQFDSTSSSGGTIALITKVNDLVEFFNLSSKYDCSSYRNDVSDQVHTVYFINTMISFLSSLKVIDEINGIDVTSLVSFIDSFQITLNSVLNLYKNLKLDGFTYDLTRKLNMDYIENFVDSVKNKYGNSELTSWQLELEFRKYYLAVFFEGRQQNGDSKNEMSGLFNNTVVQSRKNYKAGGSATASVAMNKEKPSSISNLANQQQFLVLGGMDTSTDNQTTDIVSHTVQQEPDMEADDDQTVQIKTEQEDFLAMDITIEDYGFTKPSTSFSLVKQEDPLILDSSLEQKRDTGDLAESFQLEGNEVIISTREQEHNYVSTSIKQEYPILLASSIEGSLISDNENISRSSCLIKRDRQDMTDDDSTEEEETDSLLQQSMLEAEDILQVVFSLHEKKKKESYKKCKEPISSTEFYSLNLPENNALVYISGWILERCQFCHEDCDDFNRYIQVDKAQNANNTRYSRYKDYFKNNGTSLKVIPPDDFVEYVEKLDDIFCEVLQGPQLHCRNVMSSFLNTITVWNSVDVTFAPCQCFPIDYVKQLFFRLRMHSTLEYNNELSSDTSLVHKFKVLLFK